MSVHWRAQCHAKWQRRCRRIHHLTGFEPMSPDYQRPALNTQPLVGINWTKKTVSVCTDTNLHCTVSNFLINFWTARWLLDSSHSEKARKSPQWLQKGRCKCSGMQNFIADLAPTHWVFLKELKSEISEIQMETHWVADALILRSSYPAD